jgi:phenylalanyl-tRNA synthetase alpha chain
MEPTIRPQGDDFPKLQDLMQALEVCSDKDTLAVLKAKWVGKTGCVSLAMASLRTLQPDDRRQASLHLNALKEAVLEAFATRAEVLETQAWQARLASEALDVTVPPSPRPRGVFHPLMHAMAQVIEIFTAMGFEVRTGPDVETTEHNFDALNVGPDHPARSSQDTFYLRPDLVLRTHTSPVQIRTMRSTTPPLRMISPGRVYRRDHDRTHTPMFHQCEGLVVEPGITMAHLKGCLEAFLEAFFERPITMRLRPSFFPFTEPSAEVDIACQRKGGHLELGSGQEWMEVLGCGMVHPHVFQQAGWDPGLQGFAFGMGIERLAMLKYGIADIRDLYGHDQRWLCQHGFSISSPGL